MKIEALTPDQEAHLPVFREEMRQKGLKLDWASDEDIKNSVAGIYKSAGLSEPVVIVACSPRDALLMRLIVKSCTNLRGQLEDQLRGQLEDQLRGQLGDQLRGQLEDQLRGQLGDQLEDAYQSTWFAGGSEFYWITFYRFAEMVGVKYTDKQVQWLKAWEKYAETCGALYPYEGIAFVSRRPTALSFNNDNVLHSETGPAMGFSGGFEIHAWNGTRVPNHWIEGTPDPKEVLATENVEQRAAGVAIVGMAKLLDHFDHEIIDSDPDPEHGDLVKIRFPDLPEPGFYLRAYCPRNGLFMEGVNPAEMDELTVRGAQAWRVRVPAKDFIYPEKRT